MSAPALLGALALGVAFGCGAQRGAFCMNSGFRSAVGGDWTKVKALGLAVAVQLLVLPAIFGGSAAATLAARRLEARSTRTIASPAPR